MLRSRSYCGPQKILEARIAAENLCGVGHRRVRARTEPLDLALKEPDERDADKLLWDFLVLSTCLNLTWRGKEDLVADVEQQHGLDGWRLLEVPNQYR
jgi:hypothetical protein